MMGFGDKRSLLALPVLALAVQQALAQRVVQEAAPAPEASVEQVLVTARKRSEPVTSVAMSINVIDGATIDALHLRTLPELVSQTQNVTMFEDFPGAGQPTWVIRGVGLQDYNSNNTPTAAVYADGVYQVATVMGNQALLDIDQAEILKGPQGGLYGRNTTGGAVLLNSKRARTGVSEQSFSVSYGSWQRAQLDGMANVPLADGMAWRIAGRVENSGDGWQRSLPGGEHHGERDRYDLRSWLHWDTGSRWQADWKVQGGSDDSDIALGRSVGLYDRSATPTFCVAVLAGQRDDRSCLNFGGVNYLKMGKPAQVENLALQAADGSTVYSGTFNRQANDYIGTLLELAWQGDSYRFKSLTAYDRFDYGVQLDLDGSGGEFGHRVGQSDIGVLSQELQWSSLPGANLSWLAGVVASDEDFVEHRDFDLRDNVLVGLGRGKLDYTQATSSQSVYGNVSLPLAAQWTFDATLRYTHEQKHYRDGNFYIPLASPFYFTRNLSADYNLDEHVSGSAGLDWQASDDALLYAKVSHGFKSGGFYGGFPFSAAEITPYQAETLLAYEAGLKHQSTDRRLQLAVAVFHYDYRDVQGFVRDINPITGTGVDHLANLADARHDGAEVEVQWHPLDDWRIDARAGWLDARFVDATKTSANVMGKQVLAQGRRPYAPQWSGSLALRHAQQLPAGLRAEWNVGYSFQSDFAGYQSSPVDAAVNRLPGYGKLDASLTLSAPQSPWEAMLWVSNLTDKVYRTRVKSDGLNSYVEFFGEPRAVGASVRYRH